LTNRIYRDIKDHQQTKKGLEKSVVTAHHRCEGSAELPNDMWLPQMLQIQNGDRFWTFSIPENSHWGKLEITAINCLKAGSFPYNTVTLIAISLSPFL
jgi:hypothetical protein